jgi:vacuolar-type H+-ATPase subunit H
MFEEELTAVTRAEAEADELIRQAGADARKILADGQAEAEAILVRAKEEAAGIIREKVGEGTGIADLHYAGAMDAAAQQRTDLALEAEARLEACAGRIAERIINRVDR